MAGAEGKAALVAGPVLSGRLNADGADLTEGVARITCAGGSEFVAIPPRYAQGGACMFLTIRAVGCSVQAGFSRGAAAATVTSNATGTLLAPNAAAGATIGQDTSVDWIIPAGSTFLNWRSSGAGFLEVNVSERLAL